MLAAKLQLKLLVSGIVELAAKAIRVHNWTREHQSDAWFCSAGVFVFLLTLKGARYSLIIHEVPVAMGFFPAGVQDETLKEESQSLARLSQQLF